MGQAVTVANASGDRLYVKVQSTVDISEKTDFELSASRPTSAGASASGKIDVEVDGKSLEPGHVAIDNDQSLKFARSFFTRRLLSVSKPNSKVFICHRFLVPSCTNIIIAPNNTVRYAKSGHTWVDIDGFRYRAKRSANNSQRTHKPTHSIQTVSGDSSDV